jgi:hypothetical protein
VQTTEVQEDHRWRNRLLSSPLWLLALVPILPPFAFFAYASWEPGCVSRDGGTVDIFRIGSGLTVVAQVGLCAFLAWKLRDRPGLGGVLALVGTLALFVGGWMVTLALGDAIGEGTEGASC